MGLGILGDVLESIASLEPDMVVYVPDEVEEVTLFTPVIVVQHGTYSDEDVKGYRYLLEAGVMREVLDGLERLLRSTPTAPQVLRAVLFYAEHDAFPDLDLLK